MKGLPVQGLTIIPLNGRNTLFAIQALNLSWLAQMCGTPVWNCGSLNSSCHSNIMIVISAWHCSDWRRLKLKSVLKFGKFCHKKRTCRCNDLELRPYVSAYVKTHRRLHTHMRAHLLSRGRLVELLNFGIIIREQILSNRLLPCCQPKETGWIWSLELPSNVDCAQSWASPSDRLRRLPTWL